jgi:hypothetical protein
MRYPQIAVLVLLSLQGGCLGGFGSALKQARQTPPSVEVVGSDVKVDGAAKTPAKVNTDTSDTVLTIPEGSNFVFNEKLGTLSLTISKATQMTVKRVETAIEGPVAFDPPKQPTVGEIKDAQADFYTVLALRIGAFLGIAAAIFGLVRGWDFVMLGGGIVAASSLFGLFVQKHPLLVGIICVGATLAASGVWVWHTKLKKVKLNEPD